MRILYAKSIDLSTNNHFKMALFFGKKKMKKSIE